MKVSLIVASGAHQGKAIPISRAEFLIGREGFCHLRPASQAISKKHCGILLRDGKVFVIDFGSTNGTLVNDTLLKDEEAEVEDGARISIGPLDFLLQVELDPAENQGTPFPSQPAALAAVKAIAGNAPQSPTRDGTPNPSVKSRGIFGSGKDAAALSDSKEQAALTGSKEQPALKAASGGSKPGIKGLPAQPATKPAPAAPAAQPPAPKPPTKISAAAPPEGDSDDIAAMLLGMDDDEEVPGGSTVMEMPSMAAPPPPAAKPDDKSPKKATSREEMTNAAAEILRKMARRPK